MLAEELSEKVLFFGALDLICLIAYDESSESQHLLQAGRCIPVLLDVITPRHRSRSSARASTFRKMQTAMPLPDLGFTAP